MKKKTIYLMRHGETDFNKKGAVQGRGIDADLNETGREQAAAFYHAYNHIDFDKIYVSGLKRTYQTVECFINSGVPYEKLRGLDEISWGIAEGHTLNELEDNIFVNLLAKWNSGHLNAKLSGGESPLEVVSRQKEAIKHILEEEDQKLILIATHGRAMRILLSYLMKNPIENMNRFEHSNTCLYILEYDYDFRRFEIKLENDTTHLEQMKEPLSIKDCR